MFALALYLFFIWELQFCLSLPNCGKIIPLDFGGGRFFFSFSFHAASFQTTAAEARVCLSALVLFGVWKLQLGIKERRKKGRKAHRRFAAAAEKVP